MRLSNGRLTHRIVYCCRTVDCHKTRQVVDDVRIIDIYDTDIESLS